MIYGSRKLQKIIFQYFLLFIFLHFGFTTFQLQYSFMQIKKLLTFIDVTIELVIILFKGDSHHVIIKIK